MTSVVCIKVGDKYGPEYVNKLERMVKKHTWADYEFVCLTDNYKGLECQHAFPTGTHLEGWWSKLVLFKPHPVLKDKRIVYIDLDTVIVNNIDFLFEYKKAFCILKDFWAPSHNSSVMAIRQGFGEDIYGVFDKDMMNLYSGDQDWIFNRYPGADIWQGVAPGKIGSYKADNLQNGPKDFSLICFHGDPKPHTFTEGWVKDAWV